MKETSIPKNNKILPNAKKLRKEMTKEERKLWYEFLRYYPVKIYKQRIIESYIVDFYCDNAKLVVELDGSQHFEKDKIIYDKIRTQKLESYGLKVLRFTNLEVLKQFKEVCECIDKEIKVRTPFPKGGTPSPS
ncbi:MAG: endonuclease domain-containing protein [Clostridia bacterium]